MLFINIIILSVMRTATINAYNILKLYSIIDKYVFKLILFEIMFTVPLPLQLIVFYSLVLIYDKVVQTTVTNTFIFTLISL